MDNVFALVDCNNFYASCERVFNPKLEGKPIVVLSNNDGVIIARSNEVKALGIKMATPIFKCIDVIRKNNVHVFSSNYILYGDMSERVMMTLKEFAAEIEIYSIDEAFLSFKGLHQDYEKYASTIRETIKMRTGIPVSIGIAKTKTLSKIANEIAKKDPLLNGVLDISTCSEKETDCFLARLSVGDVWGIGRRLAPMLSVHGIRTARDLKYAKDAWIKKCINIMGIRTVHELRGIACIDLEQTVKPQKSIACTRSFGAAVTEYKDLEQAIVAYASRAAEKLRQQKQIAEGLQVFVHTNRFKPIDNQYANSAGMKMPEPTCDTRVIAKHAKYLLSKIFREGLKYKKAGVILSRLAPDTNVQLSLFDVAGDGCAKDYISGYNADVKKSKCLMDTMDLLNRKFGKNTCLLASGGITKPWKMRQLQKSKRFTTSWYELIKARV